MAVSALPIYLSRRHASEDGCCPSAGLCGIVTAWLPATWTSRNRLQGCYVTLPTLFRDDAELSVDLDAMRGHVRFLIDGGITTGTGVLLAGGAAGDFSTMTFDERVAVTEAVVSEAAGRVPVVMGRPDHQHPGVGEAGAQGGRARCRLPADLAAVLFRTHRR